MADRARAVIFGVSGPVLTSEERAILRDADPWGFILFLRNIETPDQVRRLTSDLRDTVGRDAVILTDQEGGRVQRFGPPHWPAWAPIAEDLAAVPPGAREALLTARFAAMQAALCAVGVDVNCVPMLDVATRISPDIISDRVIGHTAPEVARHGAAIVAGTRAGGGLPVLKHIPGHGRAAEDTHLALPRVAADRATLSETDFAPFAALAGEALGMTAHIVFEALDPDRPATLSPSVISAIRDEIGFDGALMTDDLSMSALSGSMTERATGALAAGCDLILHRNGEMAEMTEVAAATPRLSGAAALRTARALESRPTKQALDPVMARTRYLALRNGEEVA